MEPKTEYYGDQENLKARSSEKAPMTRMKTNEDHTIFKETHGLVYRQWKRPSDLNKLAT